MKFASFGRERDIEMIKTLAADADYKSRRLAQVVAAHDLNDGLANVDEFIEASRNAIFTAGTGDPDPELVLLSRIAAYYPECNIVWEELAGGTKWHQRFSAACRLYRSIPEGLSDKLFSELRFDRSMRVRDIAISKYKNRPDEKGYVIMDVYDPDDFDERIRRGEVKV